MTWTRLAALIGLTLAACNGKDDEDDTGGGGGGGGDDSGSDLLCEATAIPCTDQIILDLSLHDDKIADDADVLTTTDGDDFVTTVDATAGGYNQAANNPWVYVKFTAAGAERVDIDDETALESMDWDLAFRRFIIRLNSGDSGPSCVGATALDSMAYDEVGSVPAGVTFDYEDFYSDSCELREDASGLPSSPDVVVGFGEWWEYTGCVETTMTPILVQLADGSVFKMAVEEYYATDQDVCNESHAGGEDSGNIKLRWRMLE